jgi:peptidoglycan/LPS O-acetylase OafA/YrhL
LALTGIWPALVILLVAVLLADSPGGFDGALIDSVKQGLARMGMADAGMPVEQLARIMAPAMAGWMVAALIICGIGAQSVLTRRGMALAATPLWRETRLPIWYGFLPGAAAVIWLSGMGGDSSLPLALFMVLLLPFFLLGLAAVHRRSAGRTARPFMLGVFYAGLVILSVPAAIAVTAFGIFEQWGRRNELPGGKT